MVRFNLPAGTKKDFFHSIFLEADSIIPILLQKEVFGQLEIRFETPPAPELRLRYGHQVSRKSEGKDRHRNIITVPAGRLNYQALTVLENQFTSALS